MHGSLQSRMMHTYYMLTNHQVNNAIKFIFENIFCALLYMYNYVWLDAYNEIRKINVRK